MLDTAVHSRGIDSRISMATLNTNFNSVFSMFSVFSVCPVLKIF